MEKICNDTKNPSTDDLGVPVVTSDSDRRQISRRTSPGGDSRRDMTSRRKRITPRRNTARTYRNYYIKDEASRRAYFDGRRSTGNSDTGNSDTGNSDKALVSRQHIVGRQDTVSKGHRASKEHSARELRSHAGDLEGPARLATSEVDLLPECNLLPVESIHDLRASVGEYLAKLRKEKGKSIRDVAESTKVPADVLKKLEIGDWSDLPAPVFLKGFIRSYVRFVGGAHHVGEDRVSRLFG